MGNRAVGDSLGTPISEAEFGQQLREFRTTAFRLELQRACSEPMEQATVSKFLAGTPEPPTAVDELRVWFDQVTALTAAGKRIIRVRVHEDPPTDYQRWERWIGRWNVQAGEGIRYLTRQRAYEVGLLPAAGDTDWWLLDSDRLIVMRFDGEHRRISNELEDDPAKVAQALAWWGLAFRTAKVLDQ